MNRLLSKLFCEVSDLTTSNSELEDLVHKLESNPALLMKAT